MRNNKGISYIEMILVIAIATILTGLVTVSIGLINRSNVSKGATRLESGFSHSKILSMSKNPSDGSITILPTNKGLCYYYGTNNKNLYKIANSPCTVWVKIDDTEFGIAENSNVKYTFTYKHDSGAFDKITKATLDDSVKDTFPMTNCSIIVRNNRGSEATLKLLPKTGNTELIN